MATGGKKFYLKKFPGEMCDSKRRWKLTTPKSVELWN